MRRREGREYKSERKNVEELSVKKCIYTLVGDNSNIINRKLYEKKT